MADIGALVVRITADASSLAKELDKIGAGGNKAAAAMKNAGTIMAGALLAATTAAVANTLAIAKQVEATDLLSQKTGISVKTLQGWSVVMAENSFQASQLATGMRALSKEILEVHDPASVAANAFAEMGIGIEKLGSTENAIKAVADKFKSMPDGAEKANLAVQLFGKSGLEMIPILNRGAAALDESKAAAQRYGLVLSTDAVNALKAADDASDNLGMALQGLRTAFAVAFAPYVESSIEAITRQLVHLKRVIFGFEGETAITQDNSAQAFLGRAIVEETQEYNQRVEASEAERMDAEEALGRKMRDRFIRNQMFIEAEKKAQEALGKAIIDIEERKRAERNKEFAEGALEAERINSVNEGLGQGGHGAKGGAFEASVKHQHEMVSNLEAINLSAGDYADQIDRGNEQELLGLKIMHESLAAHTQRHGAQELEIELQESVAAEQAALFQQQSGLFGAAEQARGVQMRLIDEQYVLEAAKIMELGILEEQKALKIQALDQRTHAKRIQVAQQFPTFWEQQLNAIQASNVFSMGQMVSTWSNAIATMIVRGGDLKAAWESTKIAIVQAFINMGVSATAAAVKTLVVNEAAAAGTAGVWGGAASFIIGAWGTVTGALGSMFATLVGMMTAVGLAIMKVLSAIASALSATVWGIPYAGAILLGVALIAASLVALKAVKFAEGGLVTGPTLGLLGEAGPEAVIPLDRMGDFGGGGGSRPIMTTINIDGKKVARALTRHTASSWRAEGAPA
jgi:hypothetical protein